MNQGKDRLEKLEILTENDYWVGWGSHADEFFSENLHKSHQVLTEKNRWDQTGFES